MAKCKNLVSVPSHTPDGLPRVCGGEIVTAEFQVLGKIEIERFCLSCGSSPDLQAFVAKERSRPHRPGSGMFHI